MTSFAGVETWPILEEQDFSDIEIPEKVHLVVVYNCSHISLSSCRIRSDNQETQAYSTNVFCSVDSGRGATGVVTMRLRFLIKASGLAARSMLAEERRGRLPTTSSLFL
jgi:hypothetical protein